MNKSEHPKDSLADELGALAHILREGDQDEKIRANEKIRQLVIALRPVETAGDALALQCLAMDLSRLMAEGVLVAQNTPAFDLMRAAIVRVAHYLETQSGQTIAQRSFLPPTGPGPVMQ